MLLYLFCNSLYQINYIVLYLAIQVCLSFNTIYNEHTNRNHPPHLGLLSQRELRAATLGLIMDQVTRLMQKSQENLYNESLQEDQLQIMLAMLYEIAAQDTMR